jgi:regulatory protein
LENVNKSKDLSYKEILDKMLRFCDYRERCKSEVYRKLKLLEIEDDELKKDLIKDLLDMDVLNESRFANSFVRGKSKIKKWGFARIRNELKYKGISDSMIEEALEQIDKTEYQSQFEEIALKKWELIKGNNQYEKKGKFFKYFYSKGYSSDLIKDFFKNHLDSTN